MRPSRAQLVTEVAAFAEQITPAKARWEYAYKSASYLFTDKRTGLQSITFHEKSMKALARVLDRGQWSVHYGLRMMRDHGGVEEARAFLQRPADRDVFAVGALEPWHLGHVYFACLDKFPHVIKVGFSRRVHERLVDIERAAHERIGYVQTKVGTAANESWWHHNWREFQIDGEWFFNPRKPERTLPDFLREKAVAA